MRDKIALRGDTRRFGRPKGGEADADIPINSPRRALPLLETNRSVHRERAILVGAYFTAQDARDTELLDELERLADTAGAQVVGRLEQQRPKPDPATCIGKGKVEELAELAGELEADVIIFDIELSPSQMRNLERAVNRKVLDRTELILDIFATHARTNAAQTQVELAQLEYAYPRLVRMWTHLSRIEGGIGMRGPGERQIEVDRRILGRRIARLKDKLHAIEERRAREVTARKREPTVSLVGYTNAGKSSLMRRLTGAEVKVEDALFATLDTRTRRWEIDDHHHVLLSDTVGFIRKLPHNLVASFHATLEEVRQADLLLHVVDASSDHAKEQADTVDTVLDELGCHDSPRLMVLNKSDLLTDQSMLPLLQRDGVPSVIVSARTGEGIEALSTEVAGLIDDASEHVEVSFSPANGRIQSFLEENANVIDRRYSATEAVFDVQIRPEVMGEVQRLGGAFSSLETAD